MKKLFRKLIALLRGSFVADCPKCHKHFYGFHDYKVHMKIENKNYRILCHRCVIALDVEKKSCQK